jgi:magnesium transporter
MEFYTRKHKKTPDSEPGSLVFIGKKKVDTPKITIMEYDEKNLNESQEIDVGTLNNHKNTPTVSWINVYGLHDIELIQKFATIFNISPLMLESILNTGQRPRFEEGENNLGFILKIISTDKSGLLLDTEQISIILGNNYVLTFQEHGTNTFESVRYRIRNSKGKIRTSDSDYLTYVIMDQIIDNYLFVIGELGEKIEDLGEKIIANPNERLSSEIYKFKVQLSYLRKNIRPVKELILLWFKSDTDIVKRKTRPFLRDLESLITQAEENIEIYNDLLVDGMNAENANVNQRMNEIMKILTVFTSVFIPLTFLAGIYGMNFKYFPELNWRYGYLTFWAISIIISILLFFFFKRKRWL